MAIITTGLVALTFIVGCWAMRKAWLGNRRQMYAGVSFASLLLGVGIAVSDFGAELGIPIAISAFAPVALLIVALGRTVRAPIRRIVREAPAQSRNIPFSDAARILAAVMLTVPITLAIGGALVVLLPFEAQTRVVVTLYLLPLLWACAIAWAISATRIRSVVIAGAGILSVCMAVLLPKLA